MTEKRLAQQLQQVARRYTSFRFWSAMTLVWAMLALAAAILLTFRSEISWSGSSVVMGFLLTAIALTLAAILFALRNRRNYLRLAQLVEGKYPDLEARLMTASHAPARLFAPLNRIERSIRCMQIFIDGMALIEFRLCSI